jgi:hypothetical protein
VPAIKNCNQRKILGATLLCFAISLGACDTIANKARGLAGGSKSSEKKSTPASTVVKPSKPETPAANEASLNAPAALPSALADPAVATKTDSSFAIGGEPDPGRDHAVRESIIAYKAQGWRDPFVSLVSGDGSRNTAKIDLSLMTLVAIVLGEGQVFAVVEDAEGNCYILREGDSVKNGKVLRIGANSVTASQTILGYTTQVQLELIDERKDVKNG